LTPPSFGVTFLLSVGVSDAETALSSGKTSCARDAVALVVLTEAVSATEVTFCVSILSRSNTASSGDITCETLR